MREDVAERVADLALAERENPSRAVRTIRDYARGMLDSGYPRGALLEDFERARVVLEGRGAGEDAEDPILDVMDFLTGFCSAGARL
jgi:hypothetical protein